MKQNLSNTFPCTFCTRELYTAAAVAVFLMVVSILLYYNCSVNVRVKEFIRMTFFSFFVIFTILLYSLVHRTVTLNDLYLGGLL